jgi:hypothetical protein
MIRIPGLSASTANEIRPLPRTRAPRVVSNSSSPSSFFAPLMLRAIHRAGRRRLPTSFSRRRVFTESYGNLPESQVPITSRLQFINSVTPGNEKIPTYRVLSGKGQLIDGAELPDVRCLYSSAIHATILIRYDVQIDENMAIRM